MSPAIVNSFIASAIGLLVIMLGFFAREWMKTLTSSLDRLGASIDGLGKTVREAERRLDGHDRDLEEHDGAIRHLHGFRCPDPNCPYHQDRRDTGTRDFVPLLRGEADFG